MFGLLNRVLWSKQRNKHHRPTSPRTVRPWLEHLEARDCPTLSGPSLSLSLTMNGLNSVTVSGHLTDRNGPADAVVSFSGVASGSTVTDSSGNFSWTTTADDLGNIIAQAVDTQGAQSNTATVVVACAAPEISGFTSSFYAGVLTLSGTVTHPDVGSGMTVLITGDPPSLGTGVTTTTAADGSFSYSFAQNTDDVGNVEASVTDCWGQQSNVPSITLVPPPAAPTISLSVTMNGLQSITLSGQVNAANPAGLTVTFTGAASGTAVTDANGNYTVTLNATSLGTVQATTTDSYGDVSNTATGTVACAAPVISGFDWKNTNGVITLSGQVTAADASGMTITFQGSVAGFLNPVTVTAAADGTFTYSFQAAGQLGSIGATCVDCWGQQSNLEVVTIS